MSRREAILSLFPVAIRVLENNPQLASKEADLSGTDVILSVIEVGGFGKFTLLDPDYHGGRGRFRFFFPEFNVKEIRPPGMDTSGKTKYPVLFKVYEDSFFPRQMAEPLALTPGICYLFYFCQLRSAHKSDGYEPVPARMGRLRCGSHALRCSRR